MSVHLQERMAAVSAALRPPAAAFVGRSMPAAGRWPFFRSLAFSSSASTAGGGKQQRQLVLYTKKGCCLCDGLKEKLEVAFLIGGPHSLSDVQLQVRDIADNPEWERLYQYEIPVVSRVLPDGSEEVLPRLSPRLGVELIQKKISTALGN